MNRLLVSASLVISLLLPDLVSAADRMLQGRVLLVGDQDQLTPVVGQDVVLVETGDTTRTKEGGRFRLFLKDVFQPGAKITLFVEKKGWRIQYPLDGEARVPDDLDKELVNVHLLPVGSKKFWSADRIEKFIRDTALKAKEQVRLEDKPKEIDLSRYIKDWAVKYGFSVQQAKAEIDKWVEEVEARNDPHQLGLAAYYKKNFSEAGKQFEGSAKKKAEQLNEASIKLKDLKLQLVLDFVLAGQAFYSGHMYEKSLSAFDQALLHVSREEAPDIWALVTSEKELASIAVGMRARGPEILRRFRNAAAKIRDVLTIVTRERRPHEWAIMHITLGMALTEEGSHLDESEGLDIFRQAITAYGESMTILTREEFPYNWATIQNDLGLTLKRMAEISDGQDKLDLLAEAVVAHNHALGVFTSNRFQEEQAWTLNNLGSALKEQGKHTTGRKGTQLLSRAIKAYGAALKVYTKASFPEDWALTQTNLCGTLGDLGIRTQEDKARDLLSQAVSACREALTIQTIDFYPQDWAMTQNNLGFSLAEEGRRVGGEEGKKLIRQGIHAYELALTVRTRETMPLKWKWTTGNLRHAQDMLSSMK